VWGVGAPRLSSLSSAVCLLLTESSLDDKQWQHSPRLKLELKLECGKGRGDPKSTYMYGVLLCRPKVSTGSWFAVPHCSQRGQRSSQAGMNLVLGDRLSRWGVEVSE
jgi:hypothetical protein